MRERSVEASIIDMVTAAGGYCLKWVCPGRRGLPDRIILLPGAVIIFLEVKRPGEKPTALQEEWLRRLRKLGFRATWADSLEAARHIIQEALIC